MKQDSEEYTPLSERLQQDVWHDNFVPKYSALATAKPSRLVLFGVSLIFAPAAVGALVTGVSTLSDAPDRTTAVVILVGSCLFLILAVAILFTQTRRYLIAKSQRDDDVDEDEDLDQISNEDVTRS